MHISTMCVRHRNLMATNTLLKNFSQKKEKKLSRASVTIEKYYIYNALTLIIKDKADRCHKTDREQITQLS